MSICCVRDCQSAMTREHRIKGESFVSFRKSLTYIIRICDPCRKVLSEKSLRLTYFQCGGLAFVNELWEDSDASKME